MKKEKVQQEVIETITIEDDDTFWETLNIKSGCSQEISVVAASATSILTICG